MSVSKQPIVIDYFTDILCVWAYSARRKVDEVEERFLGDVVINHHFVSIFGAAKEKITENWKDKGGMEGYSKFVLSLGKQFDYIELHPEVWVNDPPHSSLNIHIYLKAVQLLQAQGVIEKENSQGGRSTFEELVWQFRKAFFSQAINIGVEANQRALASTLGLPVEKIQEKIISGEAHAAIELDHQLAESYQVTGSPTFVFNEGRQKLYGNIGYRVIEANLKELIAEPVMDAASWC
jgi:predicted DsbA family dithiol-disulfide isomerase